MPSQKVVSITSGHHRQTVLARRDRLVEEHLSLVEGIARSVARSLPSCFDLEDLIGVGNLALLRLATRYRPGDHGGAPFSAYARQGIRGAIIESVRRNRYTEQTRPGLENVEELLARAPGIEKSIDTKRMAKKLTEAVSWLPDDQQRLVCSYYGPREPTLPQVAKQIGVSFAQAREMHEAAIDGVRDRFKRAA